MCSGDAQSLYPAVIQGLAYDNGTVRVADMEGAWSLSARRLHSIKTMTSSLTVAAEAMAAVFQILSYSA
jgi:hypothetical protein